MSATTEGRSLHGCLDGTKFNMSWQGPQVRDVPWLDNIKQHRVRHAVPNLICVGFFELCYPKQIEILHSVRVACAKL